MKKFCCSIFILVLIVVIFSGWLAANMLMSVSDDNKVYSFTVKEKEGVDTIGDNLLTAKLIRNQLVFKLLIKGKGAEGKIQAGEYRLSPSYSTRKIVNLLVSGEGLSGEEQITIIEGWTNVEIGKMLAEKGMSTVEEWQKAAGYPATYYNSKSKLPLPTDFSDKYGFLADKPENVGLEGYLYPDTYRIFKNSSLNDIIVKMLDNFDHKFIPEIRAEISAQNKTIFQVIILASILEKEMTTEKDRRLAADIFWRRLEINMPFQSDATVNYITKKGTTRPSREDTELDNPYNTYRYYGLPPGPICNPSMESIKAAVNPLKNDYWFFLAAPTGEIIYSKNYEEHQKNIYKYLE